MSKIRFHDLRPVLNYFPIKVGKAELVYTEQHNNGGPPFKGYILYHDKIQWCALNCFNSNKSRPDENREVKEFFLEINMPVGKVITTGLGFGVLQTNLLQRPDVDELVVVEKHEDIIRMFEIFAKESELDINRIKFVNDDAKKAKDIQADWLCMDHFECTHQTFWEIIDQVRDISYDCNSSKILFWPMPIIYNIFCEKKQIPINKSSYKQFKDTIRLSKLPDELPEECYQYFQYLRIYKY